MIVHSDASVCASVYSVLAVTSESLDLETSFLVCKYDFSMLRLRSSVKVMGVHHKSTTKYTSAVDHLQPKGNLVFYMYITDCRCTLYPWIQQDWVPDRCIFSAEARLEVVPLYCCHVNSSTSPTYCCLLSYYCISVFTSATIRMRAGGIVFYSYPCISGSVLASWKFVNVMSYEPLGEFHQIYDFGALGYKNEQVRS